LNCTKYGVNSLSPAGELVMNQCDTSVDDGCSKSNGQLSVIDNLAAKSFIHVIWQFEIHCVSMKWWQIDNDDNILGKWNLNVCPHMMIHKWNCSWFHRQTLRSGIFTFWCRFTEKYVDVNDNWFVAWFGQ
jgi:hypothetical protein